MKKKTLKSLVKGKMKMKAIESLRLIATQILQK